MACDPVVFRDGHFLADLIQQPGPMPRATIDALCEAMTAASNNTVKFDWHPVGGHPMLLYLGPYEDARKAYLACGPALRDAAEKYYHEWHAKNDKRGVWYKPGWKSTLGTEGTLAGPALVTIGQVWHHDKDQ